MSRGTFGYRPEYSKIQVESLENVELTSLVNNEVLMWDSSKGKWVNGNAGGSSDVTTNGLSNTGRLVRVTGSNRIDEVGISADASDNITGVNDLDVGGDLTVTGAMGGITAAERTQLANIDSTTISTTQWGYVGGLNQALATSNSPTFAALTVVGDMGGITAAERTQLANIDSTTISTAQWGYVGAQDQGTATTDTPTFTGLSANSQRITDLGDPVSDGDAINLGFFNSRSMIYIYASSHDSFGGFTDIVLDATEYSQGAISYDTVTGIATVEDGKIYLVVASLSLEQANTSESGSVTIRLLRGDGTAPSDFESFPGCTMRTTLASGGFGNVLSISAIHYSTGAKAGFRYLKLRTDFVGLASGCRINANKGHWSIVEIA